MLKVEVIFGYLNFFTYICNKKIYHMARKVRIKGTDIYVKCHEIGTTDYGNKGINCTYLNGDWKGASEVIPGSCLIEEEE